VPDSGGAPVQLTCSEVTTVIDAKVSGMFSKNMTTTPQDSGALFKHVADNGTKGLELVTSFIKLEMPPRPGMGATMAAAVSGTMAVEIKSSLHTFFKPVEAGKTLQTVLVYAPMHVGASIGFMNTKVNVDEGIGATVASCALQGCRLCVMGLAGAATTTSFSGASSTSLTELVFQKTEPSVVCTSMILQTAIKMKSTWANLHRPCLTTPACSTSAPRRAGRLTDFSCHSKHHRRQA
jgi:hypothetical protein